MRLKWVMTALLLFGLALLISWPFVVGAKPPETERLELARWAVRFLTYFGLTAIVFVAAAAVALLVARQAREQFRVENRRNLEEMIEGALQDHERSEP